MQTTTPATRTVPVTRVRPSILSALAPWVCARIGHRFRAVVKLAGEPTALECTRCPASWTVKRDEPGQRH